MTTPTLPASAASVSVTWRAYLGLCKLRVVGAIVFTAVIGMFLAVPEPPPLMLSFWAALGIGLAAASAAALNHVYDREADSKMGRTEYRPLPQHQLEPRQANFFAGILCLLSMAILGFLVNPLTAVLTFLSLIGYAVIYTRYLKRVTTQNIVIGGAAGAAPPVLGWCAITGSLDPHSLLLFLLIFVWTPPHFWPLALAKKDEYKLADMPMLPVIYGDAITKLHILLYTILLFISSLLPYLTHMSGLIYLGSAVLLGLGFLYFAVRLWKAQDNKLAMRTFGYSLFYLMGLFSALLVDHYVRIG
ncbi:heme o synthase [Methylomagnum ishizawai]|uniref:heme o synthase n=1 Tax=Methylomagnum ishizawai TaxID=1760988 RepID=UPI001C32745A|nr:heme o synthase [Methylomagnum ishizawai]BBL76432.1 protoheme IX farnesyltransferase [Methylomagnum ishizawai]